MALSHGVATIDDGRGAKGASVMKAVVVYESHWGNTAEIARAVAEGIGPGARAMTTEEASAEAVADADLLVVGAPVIAFSLPSPRAEDAVAATADSAPTPPTMVKPSMFWWLADLPSGTAEAAAFETHVRWSPGGATGTIERDLKRKGYRVNANSGKFLVRGRYGPLRDGELERARAWGSALRPRFGQR
jgi:flavorubredoxin